MTAYGGTISPSPIGGDFSPAAGLETLPGWPYTGNPAVLPSDTLCGALTAQSPVSMPCAEHTGYVSESIADVMYGYVYVVPGELDLGIIVAGVTTEEVELWNASLGPATCTSGSRVDLDGIDDNAPDGVFTLGALGSQVVTYEIGQGGPPAIDGAHIFYFDLNPVTLAIEGTRSLVLFFWPCGDGIVRETLSWLTDIMTSRNGLEQRVKCRLAPRRRFSLQFFPESPALCQRLDNMAHAWRGRFWSLPLFQEYAEVDPPAMGGKVILCDTRNMTLAAGDTLLLWQSNTVYAALQVDEVAADSITLKKGVSVAFTRKIRVCPVHIARLKSQPKKECHPCAGDKYTFELELQYPRAMKEGEAEETYNDLEVLSESSRLRAGSWQPVEFVKAITELDNATGQVFFYSPTDFTSQQVELSFVKLNRTAAFALRDFIVRREGRLTPFFHPLFDRCITLAEDLSASGTTLVVVDTSLVLLAEEAVRNYLMLETVSGARYYRQIQGISTGSEGYELISINQSLGEALAVAEVKRISLLALMRLDTDEIEIDWSFAPATECKVVAIEVLQ